MAWGMVALRLSVKKTVCASSKEGATECFEVASGPVAGTIVLAKVTGVLQVGVVMLEDACAKGGMLCATTASNKVEIGVIGTGRVRCL